MERIDHPRNTKMKQTKLILSLLGIFFLISIGIYIFIPMESFTSTVLTDILPILAASFAVIAGFYAYKIYGWKSVQGKIWLLLTLGIFFWFLGEFTWFVYEIMLRIPNPFPSLADAAWLLGYPIIFLSLILLWRSTGIIPAKKIIFIFIATALAAVVSSYFLLGPIATDIEISHTERFLDLAYPIGDLIIIFGALIVPFVFGKGILSRSWFIISLGFLASAVADTLFSYLTWNEIYFTAGNIFISTITDSLWILGYLIIAFGFYYQRYQLKSEIAQT